jgi:hypothetical protein
VSFPHLQILPNIDDRPYDPLVRYLFEIRNRFRWLIQVTGERVLYYRRKYVGRLCPKYDTVRQNHPMIEFCPYCYGTGIIGGYYRPIEIWVSIITSIPQRYRQFEQGFRDEFNVQGWTLWEPRLQNKDFIVRKDGRRFWIVEIKETRWRSHVLHQNFTTELIEKNHSIYKILP